MSSPRVRRRGISRLYSVEDEVLDKVSQEAEERLAAKRQARAEAKEIRMREIEKQREAEGDRIDSQYDDHLPVEPSRPPRGIRTENREMRSSPFANNSLCGSRRNSDDYDEKIGIKEYKMLMNQVTELEEKFRKAMVNNAQLENEKTTFSYEVDTLKDELEEQGELYLLAQKNFKTVSKDHDFLKRDFSDLQRENKLLQESINQMKELISENSLVLVGGEEEEESEIDSDDENSNGDNNEKHNEVKSAPRLSEMALVSHAASDILKKAGTGTLDVRLKRLAEEKQELLDEIYKLRLDYEEEKQKANKLEQLSLASTGINGQDMKLLEIQRETNKQIGDYKYKLKNAEQEITSLQSSASRLETQVNRYKTQVEAAEALEDELKSEKRRLQRELRDAQARIDELDTANAHLQKRIDKLKTIKAALHMT